MKARKCKPYCPQIPTIALYCAFVALHCSILGISCLQLPTDANPAFQPFSGIIGQFKAKPKEGRTWEVAYFVTYSRPALRGLLIRLTAQRQEIQNLVA